MMFQKKREFQEYLFRSHPSITHINVAELTKKIEKVLSEIVDVTQFFLYFIIIISFVSILNGILESRPFRIKDIALMRTLGASRMLLMLSWFSEFFSMGMMSAGLGLIFFQSFQFLVFLFFYWILR